MDKQEQIVRMANTCNNYYSCALCPYNPEDISRFIGDKWIGGCPNYDRKLVYAMSKGYRKVPDGAVVLLIGENNQALDEKTIEYFVKHNADVRKETAKEFAEKLKQAICDNTYPYFDKNGKPVNIWNTDGFDKIDELLKEYENDKTRSNRSL